YPPGALPRSALRGRPQRHAILRHPQPQPLLPRPARPAGRDPMPGRRLAVQRRTTARTGGAQPVDSLPAPRRLAGTDLPVDGAPIRRTPRQLPGLLQQLPVSGTGTTGTAPRTSADPGMDAVTTDGRSSASGLYRALP